MLMKDWFSSRVFGVVHGKNLVYNTCWEDPRLDRVALDLGSDDRIVMITSAGCNALDYALCEPSRIDAVDLNPRQNALLELKIEAIRRLDYDDFFSMFGRGRLPDAKRIYDDTLRKGLSAWSQEYWDRWIKFFDSRRRPFYFRGTSGAFARMLNVYADRVLHMRSHMEALLEASSLDEQRDVYERHIRDRMWSRLVCFAMKRDTTLSMIGVPRAQRKQIETQYTGGIIQFIKDCVEAVFMQIPMADNYFWRVYMTGSYTHECCPEYLREENFQRLKDGLVDRIHVHTNSVQGFLEKHDQPVTRYVLLDHMDWLAGRLFPALEGEWQAIVDRAGSGARAIWRSGGLRTDFLDRVNVRKDGQQIMLPELLTYHQDLAEQLHQRDRVHTYGSFYIADIAA